MTRWLLVLPLFAACTQSTVDDSFDPDAKADGSSTPLPYYDSHAATSITIDGVKATRYQLSKAMQDHGVGVLDSSTSFGCISGGAGKLAPADLKHILATPAKLQELAYAFAYTDLHEQGADDLSSNSIARGSLYTSILSVESQADWPAEDRDAFKEALRTTVRSLLSSPTAKVWRVQYAPDYTDDNWMTADPATGIVKVLTHGGDC